MKTLIYLVLFSLPLMVTAKETAKEEVIKCITLHNSLEKRMKDFSPNERFDFAVLFLEQYFSKKEADQLRSKKKEFLSDEKSANAYVSMLITKWTESCVESVPKPEPNS